jgi:hypothetical protein
MKHILFAVAAASALILPATPARAADTPTVGGSTQVKAQEGCLNQWMFNGVWRVRVTGVTFQSKDADHYNAWNVAMQWANGTAIDSLTPLDTRKNDLQLALANGDTISANSLTTTLLNQQKLDYHSFPPSGQFTYTQTFGSNDALDQANKPAKLLVTFDVAAYKKGHPDGGKFWNVKTPAYNYRIKLDCTK